MSNNEKYENYNGYIKNGKRNGIGKQIFKNGEYNGEFINNKRHGMGTYKLNGVISKGEFKKDNLWEGIIIKSIDLNIDEICFVKNGKVIEKYKRGVYIIKDNYEEYGIFKDNILWKGVCINFELNNKVMFYIKYNGKNISPNIIIDSEDENILDTIINYIHKNRSYCLSIRQKEKRTKEKSKNDIIDNIIFLLLLIKRKKKL
jgi:hypothetical protein